MKLTWCSTTLQQFLQTNMCWGLATPKQKKTSFGGSNSFKQITLGVLLHQTKREFSTKGSDSFKSIWGSTTLNQKKKKNSLHWGF